ncbi:unnamed protein product [Anisakis simplex]|uniref:LEM domain-containing protein n=1 Tax=Anisakis simplex TaxID=6269 RepID=A0A0M3JZ09_ANISI|nr:unnamed protein product [Anisakis simplex]
MSFDPGIEAATSTSVKSKTHSYSKPSECNQKRISNASSTNITANDNGKDKLRHEYSKPKQSAEVPSSDSSVYQRLSNSTKHYIATTTSERRRCANGYDIPKDTINESVIRNSAERSQASTSLFSPTKQPLLVNSNNKSYCNNLKSHPPTIVLSPPEEQATEKVKVIFEYGRDKGNKLKLVKERSTPNCLVRNKKTILLSAFVLLSFLIFSVLIVIVYALNSQP